MATKSSFYTDGPVNTGVEVAAQSSAAFYADPQAAAGSANAAASSAASAVAAAAAASASAAAAAASTSFLQSGSNAVTRTIQNKNRDFVHVRDFGAVCDGITDDTFAIQSALNTGKCVFLPDNATCKTTSTLVIAVSGTGLIGHGWRSSAISCNSAAANVPVLAVNGGVDNVHLCGFKLTRSVTAGSGSNGLHFNGNTEGSLVKDVWCENQYNGFLFKTTSLSHIYNIGAGLNLNHGVLFVDTASSGTIQWAFHGGVSGQNGNCGYAVGTGAGSHQVTLQSWTSLITFANSSYGALFLGTAAAPIYDIRLTDVLFGQDGNSEIMLDTYGGSHIISNGFFELAGTSPTGPGMLTAPSGIGHGALVTANNRDVRFSACLADGNKQSGFSLAATQENNLSGCRSSNNTAYGILLADGLTGIITGSKMIGNTSGPFSITANGTSIVASGNTPAINPSVSSALVSDVALNNASNFFDGPSVTLGQGTWLVTGQVTGTDTSNPAFIYSKLWDGTTVLSSGVSHVDTTGAAVINSLSGVITCTNGTVVKISAKSNSTTSKLVCNATAAGKDCAIAAVRVG